MDNILASLLALTSCNIEVSHSLSAEVNLKSYAAISRLPKPSLILTDNCERTVQAGSIFIRSRRVFSFEGSQIVTINFVPLHDRILVRRVEEQETTKAGLIIPDTAKDKPQEGEVLAIGKGKVKEDGKVIPLDVKKGDRILFGKYAGTEVVLDGDEHLIMREDEVLGVLAKTGSKTKAA